MRRNELPGRLREAPLRGRARSPRALLSQGPRIAGLGGPWRAASLAAVALALSAGCEAGSGTLVVALVPNPEVNTREQVARSVNRVEILLEAEGGFAGLDADVGDSWGPYEVVDEDDDGVVELLLRRSAAAAFDPFGLEPGNQGGRILGITARGLDPDRRVAALGGARGEFRVGERTRADVPFNLLPERRPLRVVSMSPPNGARDLDPPVPSVAVELGGDVDEAALIGNVLLRLESFGVELEPAFWVSYVDTGLGRVTTVNFLDCPLSSGAYTVVLGTEVCTRTGQCIDQDLGLSGSQAFEGRFLVSGTPSPPECSPMEVMSATCPEEPCAEGFTCQDGRCVSDLVPMGPASVEPECDPGLCAPPEHLCTDEGCAPDCRLYGLCLDPSRTCDPETGLCQ